MQRLALVALACASAHAAHEHQLNAPSDFEVKRAQSLPGKRYKGSTFADMSTKLNAYLGMHPAFAAGAATKACADMTAQEIQGVQALLFEARDASLDKIYQENVDNRRLRAGTLDALKARWNKLNTEVAATKDDTLAMVQRDGHCHEAVMWWVHHVSEEAKMSLAKQGVTVPTLGTNPHGATCVATLEDGKTANDATAKKVCRQYQEQVSCAACHSDGNVAPAHGFLMM